MSGGARGQDAERAGAATRIHSEPRGQDAERAGSHAVDEVMRSLSTARGQDAERAGAATRIRSGPRGQDAERAGRHSVADAPTRIHSEPSGGTDATGGAALPISRRGGGARPRGGLRVLGAVGLTAALLTAGCARPSEDRAVRDTRVGQAEGEALTVEVEGGLASVRTLGSGALEVWGQAPVFTVHVTAGAQARTDWLFTVHNAMPDAALVAVDEAGEVLAVEALPDAHATVKAWRVALRPGTTARLTVAPPDWDARQPFRFAALADVQEALSKVGDIYTRLNADPSLRFIFFAGDLTEYGTREQLEEFQQRLEAGSRIPLFATLGNHETFTDDAKEYQRLVGRASQHFTFQGVHFSLVDSGSSTVDPLVEAQLDGWLEEARDAVHVVAMHIPPLDPIGVRGGGFAIRGEAAGLVGKMARAGVDLTLYGHIHSYYAYSNAGIPAFISGGGGAIPESFDGVGRHYLAVDVDPSVGVRDVGLVRVD